MYIVKINIISSTTKYLNLFIEFFQLLEQLNDYFARLREYMMPPIIVQSWNEVLKK